MAFWGVVVKPGEPYIHPPSGGRRLKICQAILDNHVDVGWSMLHCNVGDTEAVGLCTLNPAHALMHHLELEYEENENVVFSVLGNSSVHLSGYYIHSGDGDHGHYGENLRIKTASPTDLKRDHQHDEADGKNGLSKDPANNEADGKNDISRRKPNTSKGGEDSKIMESSGVHTELPQGDAQEGNVLPSAVHEQTALLTEGKNVVEKHTVRQITISNKVVEICGIVLTGMGDVSSRNGKTASPTCFKRKHQGNETDGKNDASCKNPIISEANNKDDAPLKDAIVSEDGDDEDDHLPIYVAFFKRQAAKKKECNMLRNDNVLRDQNNAAGQVNEEKEKETMESNEVHILQPQDHKSINKGSVAQRAGGTNKRTGETGPPIMAEGFLSTGATKRKFVGKQKEDAENSGSARTEKIPIHKRLDNGLLIEDLNMGRANGKIASNGTMVTVKYVGTLLNGQIIEPMDVFKFKLGTGHVIRGWDIGIPGMRVGGKRRLTIPPSLGYGDKAHEGVPAHSWLIYEVELMKVK